jgi:hypothetical protein
MEEMLGGINKNQARLRLVLLSSSPSLTLFGRLFSPLF